MMMMMMMMMMTIKYASYSNVGDMHLSLTMCIRWFAVLMCFFLCTR